uniref:Cytochrome P450 n=1 Tax=Araucaria cunninghamii TaxID=56994 RepID=A0A0D6QT58_ARACU
MEATQMLGIPVLVLFLFFIFFNKNARHSVACGMMIMMRRRRAAYGPRSFPLVGSLFSFWKNATRHTEWYTELLAKSPTQTIVVERLGGIKTVVTANPANVEHILKTRFENYPKGKPFTTILHDLLGRGIFNSDGDAWKLQRKVASHEFNTRSLRNFVVDVVEEATGRLLSILGDQAAGRGRSRSLDMQDILQRFAFDNICKVAFGIETGSLDASLPPSELGHAMDVASRLSSMRSADPVQLVWKVKRMLNLGSERRLAEAVGVVHDFAADVIRRRRSEMTAAMAAADENPKQDLLSRFMLSVANIEGVDRPEEFLRDIIISFILAGRDTTSSAMVWFFWLLSSHPHVEDAIYDEVTSLIQAREGGVKKTSGSGGFSFSYEELQKMRYLHAAICESMRLYPPVVVDSKHALQDDVLPDETPVRRGTRVTYHPYAMGRMESIWGSDCLEFKPERWLDERGSFVHQSPFKYAVFQGGMRVCLGRDMAFIQMKYIAASVILSFRLRPVGRGVRPKLVHCLTARMAGGFPVLVERKSMPES